MLKRFTIISFVCSLVLVFWALPALAEMIVDTAWVRRYNGPGDSTDYANAIAVDGSGNVSVTGESFGSGTKADYATIKYHPNGDTVWVRRYNGPKNSEDIANAIAVDNSGNVYVTGESDEPGTSYDYATIKYGSDGNELWVRKYNGPGNRRDGALAIAVDGSDNVYVTGYSDREPHSLWDYDYVTIKYYSNGDTAWMKRYDGGINASAYAITVDGTGNVYVSGSTGDEYAPIKYYPNGDRAWVRIYNGPGNSGAYAIAVDVSGNVYVTGQSANDYATIKYYPNGDTAWVRRYDGPGNGDDWAWAITVDGFGNVYVTGQSIGIGTSWDYATIKYDSSGNELWVQRYNGPGNDEDRAYSIALDSCGNTYVTGYSWSGTDHDYATIKYDSSGNELWVIRYNGLGNGDDWACAIAVDDSNNVYVTGRTYDSGTSWDYATIKYFQALRGDVTRDGVIDIGDVVYLINYLYKNGAAPDPLVVGDCNCDEVVDLGDVVFLINYLFKGGTAPDC